MSVKNTKVCPKCSSKNTKKLVKEMKFKDTNVMIVIKSFNYQEDLKD